MCLFREFSWPIVKPFKLWIFIMTKINIHQTYLFLINILLFFHIDQNLLPLPVEQANLSLWHMITFKGIWSIYGLFVTIHSKVNPYFVCFRSRDACLRDLPSDWTAEIHAPADQTPPILCTKIDPRITEVSYNYLFNHSRFIHIFRILFCFRNIFAISLLLLYHKRYGEVWRN